VGKDGRRKMKENILGNHPLVYTPNKPIKVILKKEHKGHEVKKVKTRRRVMYFCETCDKWLGQKRGKQE